jgi:hypothetical protein
MNLINVLFIHYTLMCHNIAANYVIAVGMLGCFNSSMHEGQNMNAQ